MVTKQSQHEVVTDLISRACPPDQVSSVFTVEAIVRIASNDHSIREAEIDRLVDIALYGIPGERPLSEISFLTVAETATLMRVSKMTIYRLVHSGELPAIRVQRSFRIPEQAVREYLRQHQDIAH